MTRMYKGMSDFGITPPLTEEEAKEAIINLCKFAGLKDGTVKCWACDGNPSKFFALFNQTVGQKPLVGTSEWTFKRDDLDEIIAVGKRNTDNIEVKLVARGN